MVAPAKNVQEIQFPVDWTFRVIAQSCAGGIPEEIQKILLRYHFESPVAPGLQSKGGTYRTYQFTVILPSREIMNELASQLAAIPGVKLVL